MYGKRGGRVGATKLQFIELLERVQKLEAEVAKLKSKKAPPKKTTAKKKEAQSA